MAPLHYCRGIASRGVRMQCYGNQRDKRTIAGGGFNPG